MNSTTDMNSYHLRTDIEKAYIYLSGRTPCIQAHIYPQEQDSERQADMTVWPGSDTWPAYGKAYYSALTSGLEYRKS